jgi:hypothetical protein
MSFATRDLMIDVLPARPPELPGLGLCGQATKNDDEADECPEATRSGGSNFKNHLRERDLAALRLQLRQTLGSPSRS